jgi:hypothetical protein
VLALQVLVALLDTLGAHQAPTQQVTAGALTADDTGKVCCLWCTRLGGPPVVGSALGTEAVRQLGQADILQGAQFVSHGMERVAWELFLGLLDNGVLPGQTVVRAADRDAAGLSSCMCT